MDKKKPSKDERGNVRYLWVLVGAYLLYLAWQQLQLFLQGEVTKTLDILVCGVSGAVFAAVGAWVIYREWRAWQYAQAHKDDPETWGEAPDEDNTSADAPELNGDAGAELPEAPEFSEAEADEAESVSELEVKSVPESEAESAEESGEDDEAEAESGEARRGEEA